MGGGAATAAVDDADADADDLLDRGLRPSCMRRCM